MKYTTSNKITRLFGNLFTRKKQTDEICIDVGGVTLLISEHQEGNKIPPYVNLFTEDCTYAMTFDSLIKYITD